MWLYLKEKGIDIDLKKWFELRAKLGFGFGKGRGRGRGRRMGWRIIELLEKEGSRGSQ